MPCMLRILGVIVALCIALIREVKGLLGSCWLTPRGAAARGAALPDAALEPVQDLRPPGALIPARCSASPRLPVLPRPAAAPGAPAAYVTLLQSSRCQVGYSGRAAVVLLACVWLSAQDVWPPWPAYAAAVAATSLASCRRYSLCILAGWVLVFAECPPASWPPVLLGQRLPARWNPTATTFRLLLRKEASTAGG